MLFVNDLSIIRITERLFSILLLDLVPDFFYQFIFNRAMAVDVIRCHAGLSAVQVFPEYDTFCRKLDIRSLIHDTRALSAQLKRNRRQVFCGISHYFFADSLAAAYYMLGSIYESEREGWTPDARKAFDNFRKAADMDYAKAQYKLGNYYETGRGCTRDYAQAKEWYRKAAENGDMDAQYRLGRCYYYGLLDTKPDYGMSFHWLSQAAAQSHERAQYHLGVLYQNGEGVKQDDSLAYFWFRRAAEQGYAPGIYRLGRCYLEGRGVTASEANAIECFRAAARLGNSSAKAELLSLERD